MNVRYSGAEPKKKSFRKQFIKANTIVLIICFLIMASEIAVMALARISMEPAIKIEEKVARFLYSETVQSIFLAIATLLSIMQLILTNEKCGKSCYCQFSVNLE